MSYTSGYIVGEVHSDIVEALPKLRWVSSPEEWDAQREQITRLYVEDGMKLKDVMTIMEREHGFKARCMIGTHSAPQTSRLILAVRRCTRFGSTNGALTERTRRVTFVLFYARRPSATQLARNLLSDCESGSKISKMSKDTPSEMDSPLSMSCRVADCGLRVLQSFPATARPRCLSLRKIQ